MHAHTFDNNSKHVSVTNGIELIGSISATGVKVLTVLSASHTLTTPLIKEVNKSDIKFLYGLKAGAAMIYSVMAVTELQVI